MSLFHRTRQTLRTPQLRTFLTTTPLRSQGQQPTILSTLQPDLKTALRSKNKPQLTVLRALLADITNASKTSKPITTDANLYSLLQKQIRASSAALQEFQAAKRQDLVDKEQGQLDVLKQYAERIPKVSEEEVDGVVKSVVEELGKKGSVQVARATGMVMGRLGKGGMPIDVEVVKRGIEEVGHKEGVVLESV
ncbi:hypothetical protein BU26DRAFT_523845 [Trematosphaeria pertusa]|uniref:Altered inheritance of mitochondria protein 41 n=1 Tax=Trematosphaeria pertusa TaxID=390896 RepID=A0A6A6HYR2_9PLEO|nr:uncharacterized protein BU26DRAFT_523845 [Trematosphaeria pertusa]KAF2242842.1 hypothetical protein BU26DRAFT_523845 [Trematosphaeria pertusa]